MKISVIPGDARQDYAAALLQADGHEVQPYTAGRAADLYLFPLPTRQNPVLDSLPAGSVCLVAGNCGSHPGLRLLDYYDESVQLQNSAVTAEGALQLAMEHSSRTMWRSRVLVAGYGRIGRQLAVLLRGLFAEVTVYARREEVRSAAALEGFHISASLHGLSGFDFVFNTIPAPVFEETPDALCIELASAPGGFRDSSGVISGGGLPGRTAPLTAAGIIKDAIDRRLYKEGSL